MKRKETNRSAVPLLVAVLFLFVSVKAFGEPGAASQQAIVQSRGTGKIAGKVRVDGRLKRPPPLKVYKNRDFCGDTVPNESLLFSPDGGAQNVVITLTGIRAGKTETEPKSLVLDNRNCAFVPHVQVAPVGSEILLLNSDPILHDVHARIGSETLFNVGLPVWRQVKKLLTRTGVITIECDVLHTWMSAYILVTSGPYFAVTDRRGEFVIEGLPAGTYELEAWHEKLGRLLKKVEVMEGRTSGVDFVFRCVAC